MPKNYILTPDGKLCEESELKHWGIPGMKWGVRRYQNSDGSLTAAGKVRREYGDGADELGSYARSGKSYVGKYLDKGITDLDQFKLRYSIDVERQQYAARRRAEGDDMKPGQFFRKPHGQRADYFNSNHWFKMKYSDLESLYADSYEED